MFVTISPQNLYTEIVDKWTLSTYYKVHNTKPASKINDFATEYKKFSPKVCPKTRRY